MINLINFSQFTKIQRNNTTQIQPQKLNNNQYPNLRPLSADTISFSARTSTKPVDKNQATTISTKTRDAKKLVDKSNMGRRNVASDIRNEASYSYGLLKFNIDSLLEPLVMTHDRKNHPIDKIEYRLKSESSIMEKSCQRNLRTKKCIKEKLTDIIGARVILGDATEGGGNQVIDRLIKGVKENKIKIIEIENYRPNSKYQYASQAKLNTLAKISKEKGVWNFRNIQQNTASGYMAIHMLVELKDGFVGELQIIGKDVARLKDIEDLCYKAMDNKNIPKKYSNIDTIFKETGLRSSGDNENIELKHAFMEYTKDAYVHEREKEPTNPANSEFLHIPSDSIIPQELDFNNLFMQKSKADREHQKKN